MQAALEQATVREIHFEASEVDAWNSGLLTYVLQAYDAAEERGVAFVTDGLPPGLKGLVRLARAVPEKATHADEGKQGPLARLGTWALSQVEGSHAALEFVGEAIMSGGRLLVGRSRLRWSEFWTVAQKAGPAALGIVALINFLVGLIVAFLGSVVLGQFSAEIYNAHLVGYGMLRELGALMTGIIMAGRTGAAFAAEIGSMKVAEEIDALQTLGISHVDFLVLPRMLALFLMMPFLTVFGDAVGIFGGLLVSATMLDIDPQLFLETLFGAVGLGDFAIGVLKGTIFGLLIAYAGCLRGVQSGRSADAVGAAATSAVVTAITLILMTNALVDWLAAL
jgi:phospholipid/cholesterol/gamma-HCH transport system permease protein